MHIILYKIPVFSVFLGLLGIFRITLKIEFCLSWCLSAWPLSHIFTGNEQTPLILLHLKQPKLHRVLAVLSAVGLN